MLWLNIKTTSFRLLEAFRIMIRYYRRRPKFALIDLLLATQYLWKSPHRISKAFLMQRKARSIYTYGETPLTTLHLIAKECRILSKDLVYDLGCGPARTCFWLRLFVGCRVVGIDHLPTFIQKANRVKKWSHLSTIDFLQREITEIDLNSATVIYLYGTCLEEEVIEKLVHNLNGLKPNTRVITVSYPLTEYSPLFKVTKEFTVRFPWGKAEIYLNTKLP
jgi:SAM-dependent methyltransferase